MGSRSFHTIYDRWGNRAIDLTNTTANVPGVTRDILTFNTATNRLTEIKLAPDHTITKAVGYDPKGNQTAVGADARLYDAENRMTKATTGGAPSHYYYDTDGQRVRRLAGSGETWHVYGLDGELIAEYAYAGQSQPAPVYALKEYGYRHGQLLIAAEGAANGTNLAHGKAATQSSTYQGYTLAGRAVDGNPSGDWAANSVASTDIQAQAWWQVDLGSVQALGAVRLWNRTDCCAGRLSNFYVLVSDSPFASTDLTATLNQAGVSGYYVAGPVGVNATVQANRSGRYVRVQLAGTDYLSLAEVEVGGAVRWLVGDHLGTPRIVADQSGAAAGVTRHDYLPFGEEIQNTVGGRATQGENYGAPPDNLRQQFTGKERDTETGLDYFGARYLSSMQGRFISVDQGNIHRNYSRHFLIQSVASQVD